MAVLRAVEAGAVVVRTNERLVGGLLVAFGAVLFYLVMLDQGQLAQALFGAVAASQNHLHEFFHDGRHLGGVPCH
jgi:hypothetical protein